MSARTTLLALAAVAVAGAGAFGAYRYGLARGAGDSSTVPAVTTTPAERQPLYWHDPMYPQQRFDQPGKSPFMDMQLVPVYADSAADGTGVRIDPGLAQNLGVRLAAVVQGRLAPRVEAVGSVGYDERLVALVTARADAYVERLYVRAPLDEVRQGQVLAELYVPGWVAAQEEYLAARRIAGNAAGGPTASLQSLVGGARQRMRLAGMPEDLIAAVEQAGVVQQRVRLTAPTSGVVTELGAREGATVSAGTVLFRLNGLATVWVDAEVPEAQAPWVVADAAVEAALTALPGRSVGGRVARVLPTVDAMTRSLRARIELDNRAGLLRPGMFVRLTIVAPDRAPTLLVPSEAIIATGTRTLVIVADDGRYLPSEVSTGGEADGMTEILTGLAAGQQVVASGQFLLDSEASLKGVTGRMNETKPAPADDAGSADTRARETIAPPEASPAMPTHARPAEHAP